MPVGCTTFHCLKQYVPFFIFKKTSVLVSYIVENVFLSIANKSPLFLKKQTKKLINDTFIKYFFSVWQFKFTYIQYLENFHKVNKP